MAADSFTYSLDDETDEFLVHMGTRCEVHSWQATLSDPPRRPGRRGESRTAID